ncbi:MAG: PAS domain S-box protein [Methylocystis sp.]|uniref:PAS domain S-box protein n=1 Tax=Methylocystis sp. TaxID=1911079 RepID=UPI003DA58AF5
MEERPLSHLLLETATDAACLMDASGRVLAMNRRAETLTGYGEEELAGRPFPGRLKIGGAEIDSSLTWRLAPARQWLDVSVRRKDETEVFATGAIWRLGKGGSEGLLLKLRPEDVSSSGDAALEDIKIKLDAIFSGMADGLVVIDERGRVLLFSAGAEKLFGYAAEEVLGANVKLLMPSPYREAHDGYLEAYRRTGVRKIIGVGREVAGRRKDGSVFPMYLSIGEIWLEGRRYFVGVTHDLTRAKSVEGRLWMLSAAVEQSPVGVLISDRDGAIQYVNSAFSRLTGYSEDELLGKNPSTFKSGHTPKAQYERLWDTITSGGEWRGELEDRRKNGELYWAYDIITPLRDDHGRIRHFLALQQDVTEQRRDKEALAQSEERFRKVAQMVGEWLWEQDAGGRYTYSSDAVRDILGLSPQEVIGKTYLSLFDGGSGRSAQAERPQPFTRVVNCYRHRDGRRIFTESTGAPIFDEAGRLVKWRGVDRDITDRKNYEDALRVRNRAMEAVNVGIVICDARRPGNPNIYVNPALARMTGYTQQELLEGGMHMLQGPGTDREAIEKIRHALAAGEGCEVTLRNYRKNGEAFWNELMISPVPDETGAITHFIGVQTDVTEKRRAEENRRSLEIAREIQLSLLPGEPLRVARAAVAGLCAPATHVGGDYFDYFENAGAVDIIVADVSGHNVGAALIMTEVRSMVRARAREPGITPPAQVLHDLNDLLYDDLTRAELFITMFSCRFEPESRTLRFGSAGHNPALLLRAEAADCLELDADGMVLGAKRGVAFEDRRITLGAGDRLLLYTDGVTEAQDAEGAFFGLSRLCDSFIAHRREPPERIMTAILHDVRAFCGATPLSDDVAVVVLEVS